MKSNESLIKCSIISILIILCASSAIGLSEQGKYDFVLDEVSIIINKTSAKKNFFFVLCNDGETKKVNKKQLIKQIEIFSGQPRSLFSENYV